MSARLWEIWFSKNSVGLTCLHESGFSWTDTINEFSLTNANVLTVSVSSCWCFLKLTQFRRVRDAEESLKKQECHRVKISFFLYCLHSPASTGAQRQIIKRTIWINAILKCLKVTLSCRAELCHWSHDVWSCGHGMSDLRDEGGFTFFQDSSLLLFSLWISIWTTDVDSQHKDNKANRSKNVSQEPLMDELWRRKDAEEESLLQSSWLWNSEPEIQARWRSLANKASLSFSNDCFPLLSFQFLSVF